MLRYWLHGSAVGGGKASSGRMQTLVAQPTATLLQSTPFVVGQRSDRVVREAHRQRVLLVDRDPGVPAEHGVLAVRRNDGVKRHQELRQPPVEAVFLSRAPRTDEHAVLGVDHLEARVAVLHLVEHALVGVAVQAAAAGILDIYSCFSRPAGCAESRSETSRSRPRAFDPVAVGDTFGQVDVALGNRFHSRAGSGGGGLASPI